MNYKTMDYISNGIVVSNIKKSEIIYINKVAKDILKIKKDEDIKNMHQFITDENTFDSLKSRIIEDNQKYGKSEGIVYLKAFDGTFVEVSFCCVYENEENEIVHYIFKKAIEVVGEKQVSFKELAEHLPSGIIVMDIENELSITYANNEHYKILGLNEEDKNKDKNEIYLLKDFIFEEDLNWVMSEIYMNFSHNEDVDIEFRMKTKGDVLKWVRLYGRANISNNGEKLFYSSLKDLSQRKNIHDKLHMERVLFHKITELTDETIFKLDLRKNIIHFLGKTNDIFGDINIFENYPDSVLKLSKIHTDDIHIHEKMVGYFRDGIEKIVELRYLLAENEYEWHKVIYSFIRDSQGNPVSVVGKIINIHSQKLLEEQAKKDLLTNLYNKMTTEHEVNRLLRLKNKQSHAFFIIDIDNFKAINDNLGHHFGDMVLSDIANDIKNCFRTKDILGRTAGAGIEAVKIIRKKDILGRIGGDEFVVVMRNIADEEIVLDKAQIICSILDKTYTSENNDDSYKISASVGISMFPKHGTTYEELYKKSDSALYNIKKTSKNGYKIYSYEIENINKENIFKNNINIENNITNSNDLDNQIEQKNCVFNKNSKIEDSELSYNKIADIMNEFYNETNYNNSAMKLIKNLISIFKMDKVTSMIYNDDKCEYFKCYDCKADEDFNYYYEDLEEYYKKCINTLTHKIDNNLLDFLSLFNGQDYLYTDNYMEIKYELKHAGFVSDNEENLQEVYMFTASHESFFGYVVFERYSYNNKEKLSEQEIGLLTALCKMLNLNVRKLDLIQKYEDELLMKDVILKNEKIPMAVIEKDTFKILYHNDLYYTIFPNIEIGKVCYELLGNTNKCEECCIDKDLLMNDANHSDHQWIKKAIHFTLNNGVEAYMIYSKDSIDYVKQVNAIDNLTQALLFRGFEEYYKNFIVNSDNKYSLCVMDIDKFKYINDMFGYKTGDNILRKIAVVIREFIEQGEKFCRMNEDKFAVFIRYNGEDELNLRAKELSNKFNNMKKEYFNDVKITIMAGITLVDKNIDLNILLDQATTARKSAKGSHTNNFAYYNEEIDAKIKREMKLEERIPYAVVNNEFVPFLQPKFDLETQKICGAEALVRWVTDEGMIYPDQFIPLFEKNGFILTLDFIIYEKVMAYIRKCLDNNLPVYPISVNVSRNHIKDKNFMKKFNDLIDKYKVPLKYLELEITESVFVEDKKELIHFIDKIKESLLKVSIDDFGTAYSSLQNLTDIDVDILKIDKGFLDNVDTSDDIVTKDEILIKNIINLAKELDFNVICEGIETDEQIELLKKVGCEYGQGYVFAKPMSINDYENQYLRN